MHPRKVLWAAMVLPIKLPSSKLVSPHGFEGAEFQGGERRNQQGGMHAN